MSNSHEIKTTEYISIDNIYYGGSDELFFLEESLSEFSKHFSSGSLALTDVLVYELNKFEKIIGTMGKYSLTREEYTNTLRNYIDSNAYRQFGFISVNAIARYLERFSIKRKINFNIVLRRNFFSEKQFLDFLVNALKEDHPIILQIGKNNLSESLQTFNVVTGIEDYELILATRGEKKRVPLSSVFNYSDKELGAIYFEVLV